MFNLDTGKPIHEFTERALDAGTRAVELDDQDPWGHLVLGLAHVEQGGLAGPVRPDNTGDASWRCREAHAGCGLDAAERDADVRD